MFGVVGPGVAAAGCGFEGFVGEGFEEGAAAEGGEAGDEVVDEIAGHGFVVGEAEVVGGGVGAGWVFEEDEGVADAVGGPGDAEEGHEGCPFAGGVGLQVHAGVFAGPVDGAGDVWVGGHFGFFHIWWWAAGPRIASRMRAWRMAPSRGGRMRGKASAAILATAKRRPSAWMAW